MFSGEEESGFDILLNPLFPPQMLIYCHCNFVCILFFIFHQEFVPDSFSSAGYRVLQILHQLYIFLTDRIYLTESAFCFYYNVCFKFHVPGGSLVYSLHRILNLNKWKTSSSQAPHEDLDDKLTKELTVLNCLALFLFDFSLLVFGKKV